MKICPVVPPDQSIYPMIGNGYFNPNTKLMFNYVHALIDRDNYDGNLDIFQMRAQVDF